MKYLCIALFFILVIDLLICKIYSQIMLNRCNQTLASAPPDAKKPTMLTFLDLKVFFKLLNNFIHFSSLIRLNLFIVSYIPSHTIRNFIYRHIFKVKMGKNVAIYYGAEIRAPWNLEIGDGCIIGDKAKLDARNGIKIGKNVNFSTGVWIWTEQHGVNDENFSCEGAPVIIEDRCWCGPRTIILPGKTMKEGSVLAAGGVLTKNTEPFSINGGVPAKKIGERNRNINYELNGERMHLL